MADNPTYLLVVAIALRGDDGRWLMQRRPAGKHHAGLWEFPGGKVEPAETPSQALVREVREELGIELDPAALRPAAFVDGSRAQQGIPIVILLYTAVHWGGTVQPLDGGELGWFKDEMLLALPMPPLDVVLAGQLLARADQPAGF